MKILHILIYNIVKTTEILVLMIFSDSGANNIADSHEVLIYLMGISALHLKNLRKIHHLFLSDLLFSTIPNRSLSKENFQRKISRLLCTTKSRGIYNNGWSEKNISVIVFLISVLTFSHLLFRIRLTQLASFIWKPADIKQKNTIGKYLWKGLRQYKAAALWNQEK